jgi:acetyl esterase/lipase
MNTINYQHNKPLSAKAKMIQSTMDVIGLKKKMERRMILNDFEKEPAEPSKSILKNYNVNIDQQDGRKIWTLSPRDHQTTTVILYLHGGGYIANITKNHWQLIDTLINEIKATIVVPDYPLAPKAKCKEVYSFIESLYEKLLINYSKHRVIFTGDSAGAGLAFGFAQQLRNMNKKQPDQMILFSPWLDVTMSNPKIKLIDDFDKMLSIKGLKNAGKKYAGNLDLKDDRVSPIYGDLNDLCQLSIFTGTNDLLDADAQKCQQMMNEQNLNLNFFEYPHMFHDWVIISNLKETIDVVEKVKKLINGYKF